MFPHGHRHFVELMMEQIKLHSEKNQGYAGETGDTLGNFNRGASILRLYPGFDPSTPHGTLTMYMLKHIDRLFFDLSQGRMPSDEALADIAVYATLLRCMNYDRNERYGKDVTR
jgi:hypothetical protein